MMIQLAFSNPVAFDVFSVLVQLAATLCFIVTFCSRTLPICYPIYYQQEVFERGKFHKFLEFYFAIFQCANFKNSRIFLVPISSKFNQRSFICENFNHIIFFFTEVTIFYPKLIPRSFCKHLEGKLFLKFCKFFSQQTFFTADI